jgi:hypothetical protein
VVYRYRLERRPDGALDVTRWGEPRLDVSDSMLVVPFQIGIADEPDGGSRAAGDGALRSFLTGRLVLRGELSPFRLEVERRPVILWLDRDGEVFGRFLAAARWPRRSALQRGLDLAAAGAFNEAEAAWLGAFDELVVTDDEQWLGSGLDVEASASVVDTSLHILLARLYLDRGRLAEAAERIELARARLRREDRWQFERELLALEARLAILGGQPDQALRQLRQALGRDAELESTEIAALLALASHLAGQPADWTVACRDARSRGVDLGPIDCPGE